MFSDKKEKKKNIEPSAGQNRINEGTQLKGDISSTGFFRIDGLVEGNVKTPSKVVLGKQGVIIGTLYCDSADIEGKFEGNLQVEGTLTLRSTAIVEGDVIVGKLAIEPGATFNASCVMHSDSTKSLPAANIKLTETNEKYPFRSRLNSGESQIESKIAER